MFRLLNDPISGVSLKTVLATVGDAAKDVTDELQQTAYEWAKRHCSKKRFSDRDRIVRVCHHALSTSPFGPRRVFLLWASDTFTTVYEILPSKGADADVVTAITTKEQLKLDAHELKSVVVLVWVQQQRALAALLPA